MTRAIVTKGSGNVFRDLGFSEEKSAELTLKSSLLQALQETIKDRGWKQVEAAAAQWCRNSWPVRWLDSPSNASSISFRCWAKTSK